MLVRSFRIAALVVLIGFAITARVQAAETSANSVQDPPALSGREKVEKALDKKINIEFTEAPLSDAVEYLRNELKLEIQLDTKALEDAAVASDTPITRNLHGITARSALRLMLGGLDLTHIIEDEMLVITTPDKAAVELRTEIYPVEDLIAGTNDLGEPIDDYLPLIKIITDVNKPESWDALGGPGNIEGLRGTLVVSQTDDVHFHVKDLIAKIRDLKQLPADAQPQRQIPIGRAETAASKKIRDALHGQCHLDFNEVPLAEVVAFLRDQFKIEVQLDMKALEDAAVGSDTPVTFRAKGVATHATLKRLLQHLDLTYVIRDEVLLITTPDKACNELNVTLFPVGDLIVPNADPIDSMEQLCSAIRATVRPETWDEAGGPGAIEPVPVAQTIIILATDENTSEAAASLSKLRQNRPANGKAIPKNADPELETRIYKLHGDQAAAAPTNPPPVKPGDDKKAPVTVVAGVPPKGAKQPTPAEVAQLLQKMTEQEAWKKDGASILVFGDKLIVRQTPLMHRRIKRLLISFQLIVRENKMGGGMGGGELINDVGGGNAAGSRGFF